MLLVPVRLDVLFPRVPWMNYAIIAITTIVTFTWWLYMPENVKELFIMRSWSEPLGWFASVLVHGDIFHWFFNMMFLWVFGNAICSKIGSWRYLGLYLFFTLTAACFHLLMADGGAIGASGAINGVIGFYFALYPVNQIKMFYWLLLRPGTFQVDGYWIILFWLLGDIFGALTGGAGIAYGAHLGGFIGGMGLAFLFLKFKLVEFQRADNNHLFQRFFGSFVIDDITKEMQDYCASLGSKEFKVKINDLDEQPIPADMLVRMMQIKQVKGTDLIYDRLQDQWMGLSRYLHQEVEQHKKQGKTITKIEPTVPVSPVVSHAPEAGPSISDNIRSWGQEDFYIYRDGQNHGPYPAPLLADYLDQQQVSLEDLIFNKSLQEWQALKDIFSEGKNT
ncbi:rhomboid family intramembrane serine protease [Lentisphaera profundi]|uniref:Rhomboid family intramembrane serine protease n=1 Tax=Lentisphaera profundi TaxID=1658616 RepID=A0ABY7VR05_9BACT|nr:rhomboid family intramembrane serine protease [Lentisphaera profundi]WDE96286.1 rhomboid family intramembrane serine protease [Lentisphaera profundi]